MYHPFCAIISILVEFFSNTLAKLYRLQNKRVKATFYKAALTFIYLMSYCIPYTRLVSLQKLHKLNLLHPVTVHQTLLRFVQPLSLELMHVRNLQLARCFLSTSHSQSL